MPLWVELEGQSRDRDLVIEARTARASFHSAVELPAGGRKRLPLLVWLDAADREAGALTLRLLDERGEALAAERLDVEPLGNRRLSLYVAGDALGLPAGLEADPRRSLALQVGPEDLPESALAWAAVDRALLDGAAWEGLATRQREALRGWVALGGQLLLAGGEGGAALLDGLPEVMRPADPGGLRTETRLPSLGALAGLASPSGSLRLLELEPRPEATWLLGSRDGLPLALARRYGDGAVVALAFDPSAPAFEGWPGMPALWSALDLPRPGSAWSAPPPDPAWMASGIPTGRGLPPMGWALVVLGIYILLVGPGNYALLARRRRLDLAWLSVPLLALLTSGLLYGIGRLVQDRAPRLHQQTALRVLPEPGLALLSAYVGLWSPASRPQELALPGGLARPAPGTEGPGRLQVWMEPEGSRVRELELAPARLGGFAVDALIDWPDGRPPEPLRLREGRVEGRLRNPVGRTLAEAELLTPGGRDELGALAPDQVVTVASDYRPERALELDARGPRGHLLAALLADGMQPPSPLAAAFQPRDFTRPEAILIGWLAEPPLLARLESARAAAGVETLVYAYQPLGLGGRMRFLDGLTTRRSPESAKACGPAGAVLTPEHELAEFAFALGADRPWPDSVWLSLIGPDAELLAERGLEAAGAPQVLVAVWDPEARRWLDFDRLAAGASTRIPRLITSAEGGDQIRLRITRDTEVVGLGAWDALREACWEPRLAAVEGGDDG